MWLLNVESYQLHNFVGNAPRYAILSHRWQEEEVTFANLRDCQMVEDNLSRLSNEEEELFPLLRQLREYRRKRLGTMKGWRKVVGFCQIAQRHGLSWVWVDTVCIDKSSSAELQEAINAMFQWYKNADTCFVYLHDVKGKLANKTGLTNGGYTDESLHEPVMHEFRASEWFTRGWTLQELLAPESSNIIFLNRHWVLLGTARTLATPISGVTGIPQFIFTFNPKALAHNILASQSSATKMSWAAHRHVTRGEDAAYSLIGVFDVNMPLLYGEGSRKAFERLQLEIFRKLGDETLLLWNPIWNSGLPRQWIFAESPKEFAHCGNLTRIRSKRTIEGTMEMTDRGLLMTAILIDRQHKSIPGVLRRATQWWTRYAVPISGYLEPESPGSPLETVFVQLEWNEGILAYQRRGAAFKVTIDWSKLEKYSETKNIFLQSDEWRPHQSYAREVD